MCIRDRLQTLIISSVQHLPQLSPVVQTEHCDQSSLSHLGVLVGAELQDRVKEVELLLRTLHDEGFHEAHTGQRSSLALCK